MDNYKNRPKFIEIEGPVQQVNEVREEPHRKKYKRPNKIVPIGFDLSKYVFGDIYSQAVFLYTSFRFPDYFHIETDAVNYVKDFVNEDNLRQYGTNSYIDFAFDNMVMFKINTNIIPKHVQVYIYFVINDEIRDYFIPGLRDTYGDNYIINIRQHYNPNVSNEELIEEYELKIIELFTRIMQTRYCELIFIENHLNNLTTQNFLSKQEYRQYISNLYLKLELLEKSKYIYENRNDPNVNSILIGKKKIDKYYIDYVKEKFKNDRITNTFANAQNIVVNQNPVDYDARVQPIQLTPDQRATNSFDLKYNKKYYALHHVAFPGTYQMDLVFSRTNNNCFLVAIEVNTRYVYATRTNVELFYDDQLHLEQKSTFAIYLAMQKLFDQGWNPSIIKSDSEPAFTTPFIKEKIYDKRGIMFQTVFRTKGAYNKTQPMHTSLSIIDRFVKTLKSEFLYIGYLDGELPSDLVDKFVDYYNNERKHSTLSKILKTPTTPAQVHNDIKKEVLIIKDRIIKNKEIMRRHGWHLPRGTKIKVYKGNDKFNKLRSVRPEKHIVLDNLRNIYLIGNPRTGEKELISRINIAKD